MKTILAIVAILMLAGAAGAQTKVRIIEADNNATSEVRRALISKVATSPRLELVTNDTWSVLVHTMCIPAATTDPQLRLVGFSCAYRIEYENQWFVNTPLLQLAVLSGSSEEIASDMFATLVECTTADSIKAAQDRINEIVVRDVNIVAESQKRTKTNGGGQ